MIEVVASARGYLARVQFEDMLIGRCDACPLVAAAKAFSCAVAYIDSRRSFVEDLAYMVARDAELAGV